MTDAAYTAAESLPIALVERETGVSKDALRVWERRYGFPKPERGAAGERMYPAAQVDQLRIIKRLLDSGHRPGRTVGLALEDLKSLGDSGKRVGEPAPAMASPQLKQCIASVQSNDVVGLRRQLAQVLVTRGLDRLLTELVSPLNVSVGDLWMRGEIEVFQEHAYSQVVTAVLRSAIDLVPDSRSLRQPRVLLTTLANEPHSLGLLMAEAMMALEGCECLSLGTQTPVADICSAARIHRTDIVALSFTGVIGSRQMSDGLAQLRNGLPASREIWAGGQFAQLQRRHLGGATVIDALGDIPRHVHEWRIGHPSNAVDTD